MKKILTLCPKKGTNERGSESLKTVVFHPLALKVIQAWPDHAKREFGATLLRLQRRERIGMPDARPMAVIANGVFELRVSTHGLAFRAFYLDFSKDQILVFHAFEKRSQKTPKIEIDTGKRRLKTLLESREKQ
jgi:phage-related protein